MSRSRNPNGVRRAHTRNGKPVRATGIKPRQAPKKRLNAAAKRRAQRKPLLAGAAGLLGLGALDAILSGRWGGFLVLGSLAVGLTVTHYAWQHHKNRQAQRAKRPKAKPQQPGWQAPSIADAHYSGHRAQCNCPKCQPRNGATPAVQEPDAGKQKKAAEKRRQAKMAEARRWRGWKAFMREGQGPQPDDPPEPAGVRRTPAKTGPWKQPPALSSDGREEPIGPRPEPPLPRSRKGYEQPEWAKASTAGDSK